MSSYLDNYLKAVGQEQRAKQARYQEAVGPSEAKGGLGSTAPPDAGQYAQPYRPPGAPQLPWPVRLEALRRGIVDEAEILGLEIGRPTAEAVGATVGWFGHEVADRESNARAGVYQGLAGPPTHYTPEQQRSIPLLERLATRAGEMPIVRDPARALLDTGSMVLRGLVQNEPPPGLPSHGAAYEYSKRAGVDPATATVLEIAGSEGGFQLAGKAARGSIVPLAKTAGRATEPIRQVPGVRDFLDTFGRQGASVRAYLPTEPTQKNWMKQLLSDVRDPKYRDYVMTGISDKTLRKKAEALKGGKLDKEEIEELQFWTNRREQFRRMQRGGAGVAELSARRREEALPDFMRAVQSIATRYGIDEGDASNQIRDALEEWPRMEAQGRLPELRSRYTADEWRAIEQTRDALEMERTLGAQVGQRETTLSSNVEKRARIVAAREKKLKRAELRVAETKARGMALDQRAQRKGKAWGYQRSFDDLAVDEEDVLAKLQAAREEGQINWHESGASLEAWHGDEVSDDIMDADTFQEYADLAEVKGFPKAAAPGYQGVQEAHVENFARSMMGDEEYFRALKAQRDRGRVMQHGQDVDQGLPGQIAQTGRKLGEEEAQLRDARVALDDALFKFEDRSWIDLPRNEDGTLNVEAALALVDRRKERLVGYAPAHATDVGQRFMGAEQQVRPGAGQLGTGLGEARSRSPVQSANEVEAVVQGSPSWQNYTDPHAPLMERLGLPAREAMGRAEPPRFWGNFRDEMVEHGAHRDRALGHAHLVRDILADPRFAMKSDEAPKDWIPLAKPTIERPTPKGPNPTVHVKGKRESTAGILSGFDDETAEQLKGLSVSPDMHKLMENLQESIAANADRGAMKIMPTIHKYYKPLVTLPRPEFWERNIAHSVYVQTGKGNWDKQNYIDGLDLVRGTLNKDFHVNPGVVEQAVKGSRRAAAQQMDAATLRDLFVRHRIISAGQGNILKGGGQLLDKAAGGYQTIEDGLRASYALHLMKKGWSLERIAREVDNTMFNYGPETMSRVQRLLKDQAVPFLPWTIGIFRLTGRDAFERPGSIGRLANIQDIGFSDTELPPAGEEALRRDPFVAERFGFPTKYDASKDALTMANLGWAGYTDPGAALSFRPGRYNAAVGPLESQLQYGVSLTNPLLNFGYSMASGEKAYSGGKLSAETQLPSWMGLIPGVPKKSGYPVGPGWVDQLARSGGSVPNVPGSIVGAASGSEPTAWEDIRKLLFADTRSTMPMSRVIEHDRVRDKMIRGDVRRSRYGQKGFERRLQQQREFENTLQPDTVTVDSYLKLIGGF